MLGGDFDKNIKKLKSTIRVQSTPLYIEEGAVKNSAKIILAFREAENASKGLFKILNTMAHEIK